ncbi:hypothetical protein [Hyalangium gracile]|uniref:hypothetical protein n=1 Tax=Hyalangium gracile TaxID=394092 RepID=UPI001CCAA1AD|nr:hypothetical protein [Hyalangium gracile]
MVPGTPYDSARVDALLTEKGVFARPDGQRIWRLKNGDVEVGLVRENGQVIATELRVPLSDKTELVREVVEEGAALATAAEARLIDPQLGRTLTANDSGSVADQFLRTARYAGEMMGVSEAVAASYAPPPEVLPSSVKYFVAIVGGLIFLYVLVTSLMEKLGG